VNVIDSVIKGFEAFYATPFGAGVGFLSLIWIVVDIVKKATK
jgi:hypothetical protein